jgi:hypothetical protein
VRVSALELPDHGLDVGPGQVLDLLLTELLTDGFQDVAITETRDLPYVVAGVKPPLCQIIERHVVTFDQSPAIPSCLNLVLLGPGFGHGAERVALLDLSAVRPFPDRDDQR